MNEKQIRQTAGVSAHLALPGPVGAGGDQQADGWRGGRVDGWRDGGAHCALQMVQGLVMGEEWGSEMDGVTVIGSPRLTLTAPLTPPTLRPNPHPLQTLIHAAGDHHQDWILNQGAKFTANGEISCDPSSSHVSRCFNTNKKPLLLLMSHALLLTSAYWPEWVAACRPEPLLEWISQGKKHKLNSLPLLNVPGESCLTINFSPDPSGAASTNY